MAAAAAARAWLEARRRRWRAPPSASARNDNDCGTIKLATFLLVVLAGAIMVFAVIGFAVARRHDIRLTTEHQSALRRALNEFGAAFGEVDRVNGAQLRLIEGRAGLKDLRFSGDPTTDGDRDVWSLENDRGRIVGWFSWTADHTFEQAMDRLWLVVGLAGAALATCAALAARAGRRLAGSLRRSNETLHRLTYEDALTGLPNWRAILAYLDGILKSGGSAVIMALIDIDGFREINDALGRSAGDAVLLRIAEEIKAGLPDSARLGRIEADRFAVISRGETLAGAALADAIHSALLRPIFVGRIWQITAGVGIAQAPQDGASGEELARRAGLALRAAKSEGRCATRCFEPQIEVTHTDRQSLLRELEAAVSRQEFDLHYQPIVAAEGGSVVGVEALLRFSHSTRGAVAPSVLVSLAEQNDLMPKLGEIVLRRALTDGASWPNLSVAVNLSPLQIRDPGLVDLVGAVLAETSIASSRVVLEVTEGVLIDNPQQAQTRLEALRALGVSIALDDFGTGYSSLSYLQKFPIDRLKIDRAFVASLGRSANAAAIIHSIVTLGHALGMTVLAEGVETDEQRVLLRLAGCDEMQGFLFARPAPAAEIDKILLHQQASVAKMRVLYPALEAERAEQTAGL